MYLMLLCNKMVCFLKESDFMQDKKRLIDIRVFAEEIRVETLKGLKPFGSGHVGGSMSIVEPLAVLYHDVLRIDPKNPKMRNRDFVVYSKGHAGPVVYATLGLKGYYDIEEIKTLNQGGTKFPSHTDRLKTPGIDMTTGSLGQGFSSACGIALGNKIDGLDLKTFVFVGDGELNEGQCWEAAAFAAHQKLDKFTVFVDYNKKQLDGDIADISGDFDFAEKFKSFGFHTQTIDGHDISAILTALDNAENEKNRPSCIVLDTIKGKGCTIAEPIDKNHSVNFTPEQMDGAIEFAEQVLAKARME